MVLARSTSCWLCEGVSDNEAFRLVGLRWVGLTGGLIGGEERKRPVLGGEVEERRGVVEEGRGASNGNGSDTGSDRDKG